MAKVFAPVRYIAGAALLLFILAVAAPVSAQQPGQVNPTAQSVQEEQLFREMQRLEGRITIPDRRRACWSSRRAETGGSLVR